MTSSPNVSISFFDHGVDLYLSEEEFAHLVEALGGLQPLPYRPFSTEGGLGPTGPIVSLALPKKPS
jgi:hypothetical protein